MIRTLVLAGACAVALPAPALAAGPTPAEKAFYEIFKDYTRTGEINPCAYTTEKLELALEAVGPDTRQYATDLPRAIRTAISSRARGACEVPTATPVPTAAPTVAAAVPPPVTPKGGGGPKAPEAPAVPLRTVVPEPPAPVVASTSAQEPLPQVELDRAAAARPGNDAPVPLIGLGVLSALVLLAAALLSTLRRLGRPAGRLAAQHHAWREASWRAGGVWADFRDWFATGR
jgi:hypothetical protein